MKGRMTMVMRHFDKMIMKEARADVRSLLHGSEYLRDGGIDWSSPSWTIQEVWHLATLAAKCQGEGMPDALRLRLLERSSREGCWPLCME